MRHKHLIKGPVLLGVFCASLFSVIGPVAAQDLPGFPIEDFLGYTNQRSTHICTCKTWEADFFAHHRYRDARATPNARHARDTRNDG